MNSYIKINFSCKHNANWEEKKKYLSSLFDNFEKHKMGFFSKFNNAIGFKNVVPDYVSKYPIVLEEKIKSPDDYVAPTDLFVKILPDVSLKNKELFSLYVKDGIEKHFVDAFTYNHFDMSKKLVSFLQKVFPDLDITFDIVNKYNPNLKKQIFNYFFLCMDENEYNTTVECSMPRLLTNVELLYIEKILKEFYNYPFHLNQFFCETCQKHDPKNPYHVEIVYD